jgi:hypothetical protein
MLLEESRFPSVLHQAGVHVSVWRRGRGERSERGGDTRRTAVEAHELGGGSVAAHDGARSGFVLFELGANHIAQQRQRGLGRQRARDQRLGEAVIVRLVQLHVQPIDDAGTLPLHPQPQASRW